MNDAPRRLVRPDDRWIGGVCGGVADYLGLDPTVLRLLTVIVAVFSLGSVLLAYVIAWVLIPSA